jgi:hypothetical protein
LYQLQFGVPGQSRRDAEMSCGPMAQVAHGLDQLLASPRKGIGNLGRRSAPDLPADNAVDFKLPELCGQHLLADAGKKIAKFREPFRAEAKMPDGEHLPFAANRIDRCRHGTAVVVFHKASDH